MLGVVPEHFFLFKVFYKLIRIYQKHSYLCRAIKQNTKNTQK